MKEKPPELQVVRDWNDVPFHENDLEEARFWMSHTVDPALMQRSLVSADNTESTTITLRMDPRMLSKIKRVARLRYLNYQSMIKQWLSERLEHETRER